MLSFYLLSLLTEAFELSFVLLRKLIQPTYVQLPCYDFTPIINPTLDEASSRRLDDRLWDTDSHGVTGGVYKGPERIHHDMLICDY